MYCVGVFHVFSSKENSIYPVSDINHECNLSFNPLNSVLQVRKVKISQEHIHLQSGKKKYLNFVLFGSRARLIPVFST